MPLAVRTVDVLVIAAVAGIVLGAPFDRDRQFAAGRNRSRQNLGDRAAALLSGIPGHEDRTRPVGELREIDPTAAVDHYHEVRVGFATAAISAACPSGRAKVRSWFSRSVSLSKPAQ